MFFFPQLCLRLMALSSVSIIKPKLSFYFNDRYDFIRFINIIAYEFIYRKFLIDGDLGRTGGRSPQSLRWGIAHGYVHPIFWKNVILILYH